MKKILDLIKQIGFIKTNHKFDDYYIYSYKTYNLFFKKENMGVSITDNRITDLIYFDMDLENQYEFKMVYNFLITEFKYELRKQKIDNFLN